MSIIHSALKKAEGEREKRLEPYQISVEEILALAEKNPPVQPPRRKPEGRIWNLRRLAKSAGVLGITLLVAGSHFLSFRLLESQKFFDSPLGPWLARGPQRQYSPGVQAPGEWPSGARSLDSSRRNENSHPGLRPVLSSPLGSPPESEKTTTAQAPKASGQVAPARSQSVPIVDPAPLVESKEFHLTGVAVSGGRWTAVLNNRLVEVGDLILGAQVVAIEERRVFLERRGKRFVASFAP